MQVDKCLSVAKGDTIDVVAYGMYQQAARANWSFSLATRYRYSESVKGFVRNSG
ncbi:hypothetical protein [Hymenobacter rubripertinctus]|uniref:hypothetical protein n=1 Tax=Hymenobacter rubripertinctus TaxID=2029981 RepID=UPI001601F690|nr:hypothetical protein [Hymenobacter rubripertinctus]